MRRAPNKWPDTEKSRGVLFVAQLLREMLHPETFESFRVYSLDSLARVAEAQRVLEDVRLQRLPPAALDPIMAELDWSLRRDPIAMSLAPDAVSALRQALETKKRELPSIKAALVFTDKQLSPGYKAAIEVRILQLFDQPKRKVDVRAATAAYCAFLINRGYSRRFLADAVETSFFTDDVKRAGAKTLQGFFNEMNALDRRFRVCAAVSDGFGRYLANLPGANVVTYAELPQHVSSAFKSRPDFDAHWRYTERLVEAKDDYAAGSELHLYLTSVQAITLLGRRGVPFSWHSNIYAYRSASTKGRFVRDEAVRLQKNVIPTGGAIKALQSQSTQLLTQFDMSSTERLISSINTCALARSSTDKENALISLWSAVEVLLSDPPPGTPRIVHYVDKLVPAICLKYVRRYIVALVDELHVAYRKKFIEVLRDLPPELNTDVYTRFTHLMFDEAHIAARDKLFVICQDNPLAMHRIWKLHKDFSTPAALKDSLDHHQERVGWQRHRIYRARNDLVHAGRVPAYLSSLVLNAFEYYRSALLTVLGHATKEGGQSDVDQAVAEIGLLYGIYKERVSKAGAVFAPSEFGNVYK